MKRGIFVGSVTVDLIFYLERYPKLNEKIKAEDFLCLAGGTATNGAVTFSHFNNDTTLITALGSNNFAQIAKHDLEKSKVKIMNFVSSPKSLPSISTIQIDTKTGERTIVNIPSRNNLLAVAKVNKNLFKGASIIMVDRHFLDVSLKVAKIGKELGIPVVLDAGHYKKGIEDVLPYVDYVICPDDFYLPGFTTKENLINKVKSYGIKHIAITRGYKNILGFENGKKFKIEVPKIKAVDTLGAGDIFHGAFANYIVKGNSFIESLRKASLVAAESCKYHGTREWMNHIR